MLSYRSGRLCVDGRPVAEIVGAQPTPFFLVSEARLRANYRALARGLSSAPATATIRYCVKTNNEAGILEILAAEGAHALVSHPAEARLALQCGFAPGQLAYQSPLLREDDVQAVVAEGITFVHIFRHVDLGLIERSASRLRRRVRVSLRLRNAGFALGALSGRLGFARREILDAARRVRESSWLELAAINFYVGTQRRSPGRYRRRLREAARLAAAIHAQTRAPVPEINVGGGVPSPPVHRQSRARAWARPLTDGDGQPEALEAFSRRLSDLFVSVARRAGLDPLPTLALEPGRAVVGNAMVLVAGVRAIQGRWAFLDASRNHLPESRWLFSRSILPEREPTGNGRRYYHLSGSTLNTVDVLGLARRLPRLREGDLLVLADAGAYSISRAARHAGLSPAVLLLGEDGSLRMLRRPEDLCDLTHPMTPLGEGSAIHE